MLKNIRRQDADPAVLRPARQIRTIRRRRAQLFAASKSRFVFLSSEGLLSRSGLSQYRVA